MKKPLKILHILDHSLPLHSGYTFRSRNIFLAQQKLGWQPVVLTSPKHEESLKKYSSIAAEIDGVLYYRSGAVSSPGIPIAGELALMYRLYRRLLDVIQMEQPDIIHAHSPVLNALPALWAGRRFGIPVVYEIRAFWEDAAVDHGSYREGSWKYRLTQSLETWVCRRASQVAILCDGLKNDLIKRGIPAEKITPVFNGVNLEDFKTTEPDSEYRQNWRLTGKTVIGFIGSFYRYEGLDLLVKAFAEIAKSYPDTVLLLVGGGEVEQEIKEQVEHLQLQDRVIMPGRIPHTRVPGAYSLIDILVYPRYSMRLTELVTPLKPLEAMAMGKVLVASNVGGHHELIKDGKTGVLFAAGSDHALADALTRLLDNPQFREKLQETALKWVAKNHSWSKTTSVYKQIYSGCLK